MSVKRYSATSQDQFGRYLTTRYPDIERRPTDLYIISREGDRLDLLANEFYGDARYWWIIAQANDGIDKGSYVLSPSLQIRIPYPLEDYTTALQAAEDNK